MDIEYRENGVLLGFLGIDNMLYIRTDSCSISGTPNESLNEFIKKMNRGQPIYHFYDKEFNRAYKKFGIGVGKRAYKESEGKR